jgi:hypothetical protein
LALLRLLLRQEDGRQEHRKCEQANQSWFYCKSFAPLKAMEVQLTPDKRAFVRQAIESGRLRHEKDAVGFAA